MKAGLFLCVLPLLLWGRPHGVQGDVCGLALRLRLDKGEEILSFLPKEVLPGVER